MTDEDKIREKCFEMATNLMWEKESMTSEKIDGHMLELSVMADRLVEIANEIRDIYQELGCITDVLCRAIEYLNDTQGIPPLRGNYEWFDYSLHTLIELACPNYRIEGSDWDFIKIDLKNRIIKGL